MNYTEQDIIEERESPRWRLDDLFRLTEELGFNESLQLFVEYLLEYESLRTRLIDEKGVYAVFLEKSELWDYCFVEQMSPSFLFNDGQVDIFYGEGESESDEEDILFKISKAVGLVSLDSRNTCPLMAGDFIYYNTGRLEELSADSEILSKYKSIDAFTTAESIKSTAAYEKYLKENPDFMIKHNTPLWELAEVEVGLYRPKPNYENSVQRMTKNYYPDGFYKNRCLNDSGNKLSDVLSVLFPVHNSAVDQ